MGVFVSDDGFTLRGHAVLWSTVRAIVTYKHDLFTHDEICLAFKVSGDSWVEVSEDEPGFQSLVDAVARRYSTAPPDWFRAVMLPPFATNYRVLWAAA